MRARLAIIASKIKVELREVVLRDKPESMLLASPKGTVPVLVLPDEKIIEESLDIANWAISQCDSEGWLDYSQIIIDHMYALIEENDGQFKDALDAYKYPNKFPDIGRENARGQGAKFIRKLDAMLDEQHYLFGNRFSFADAMILPFIRQFAHVDQDWFYDQDWENVISWLDKFKTGKRFANVMTKYDQWQEGSKGVEFMGE